MMLGVLAFGAVVFAGGMLVGILLAERVLLGGSDQHLQK